MPEGDHYYFNSEALNASPQPTRKDETNVREEEIIKIAFPVHYVRDINLSIRQVP